MSLRWFARREAAASSSAVVYFVYRDTCTNELGGWNLEGTHVEGFVRDGKDLEVGVLADSHCDEVVQGERRRPWWSS